MNRRHPRRRGTLLLALLAGLSLSPVQAVRADSYDQRFLEGLRQRQLFSLAERACREQLQRPGLSAADEAEWTIELSRSLLGRALSLPPAERPPLVQQALDAVDGLLRAKPQHPRLLLLQTQGALVQLMTGELLRQESELLLGDPRRVESARAALRDAVDRIERVTPEIDRELRERNLGRAPHAESLSAGELIQLQKNVALYRARTLRQQGQSYPPDSADRVAALTKSTEALASLVGLDPSDPVCFAARLDEIVCLRLLGDRNGAARRIAALDELSPPAAVLWRAKAETLRLLLEAEQIPTALDLAANEPPAGTSSPEWDFAVLEANVAAWRAASQKQDKPAIERWQQAAAKQVQRIDARHGAYWSRRAETLLASRAAGTLGSDDLEILKRSAESFFRAGQLDSSLAAYDDVSRRAASAGNAEMAFEAAFTAAAIEQSRNRPDAAAERFQKAALAWPTLTKAREAHLAAIWNLAQAHPRPTAAETETYLAWIAEHFKHWPQGATADQARLWLAEWHFARGEWSATIDAARPIETAELREPARRWMARAYQAWLGAEQGAGRATAALARTAVDDFERLLTGPSGQLPTKGTGAERVAASAAARIALDHLSGSAERVERRLAAALADSEDADPGWVSEARQLHLRALASLGAYPAAREIAEQLSTLGDTERIALAESLTRTLSQTPLEQRAELGRLARTILEPPTSAAPRSVEWERRYHLALAAALAASGDRPGAIALYESLSKQSPQDGAIQEAFAALLSAGDSPTDQAAALDKWREIERRSKPGSERWFQAKLALVRGHLKQGNRERARQIVELTELLHPELGGEALKAEFMKLKQRLGP